MTLRQAHQRGGLPVAFGAEAVAFGHQPLAGEPRELLEPVQILESRREGTEATGLEERSHGDLLTRGVAQDFALLAAFSAARAAIVYVSSYSLSKRSTSASETSAIGPTRSPDAVAIDRPAELNLRLDAIATRDGDLAHVHAAEARNLEPA